MKKTVKDFKESLAALKDETPVVLFSNGFKVNINLNVANGALLISADDMPKPSIKTAIEWDGHEELRYSNCQTDGGDDGDKFKSTL